MGIFSRSKPQQITDPVFGELTLDRFGWKGGIASPEGAGTIWVHVDRTEGPPQDADRTAMTAFLRNYPELVPALKNALFHLWTPWLEGSWGSTCPTSPEALWAMLQLEGATVTHSGAVDLLYAFQGEFWPDAMFNVQVDGMSVTALSLDD